MLEINPGLILWTIVTFVLLVALLKRMAWKPLLEALQRREDHIRSSLDRAEQAKQEAERILEENRRELGRAGEESRRILEEGRRLAEKLKNDIVEKAGQQSRRMIDQARLEIERDKEQAVLQLRGEVAQLAVLAAGKILGEVIDGKKHAKLVDDVLGSLPRN